MKTWRTLIIDDEPLARLELKTLLAAFGQILVVGEADSVDSAKKLIELLHPDLLFLDIDLGAQTGFDLLEEVPVLFHTIFVTAFDKYAIRAFEVNALDYLLKPVHPRRLNETVKRLEDQVKPVTDIKLETSDKILINNHNQTKFVTVKSISFIEAMGDYTRICTDNNYRGVVHQTISRWAERLPENLFLRVHRSYLVNINQIKQLEKQPTGSVNAILNDQVQIPVSRNNLKNIKARFRFDK